MQPSVDETSIPAIFANTHFDSSSGLKNPPPNFSESTDGGNVVREYERSKEVELVLAANTFLTHDFASMQTKLENKERAAAERRDD